jgi:hypothetical protein
LEKLSRAHLNAAHPLEVSSPDQVVDLSFEEEQAEDIFDLCESLDIVGTLTQMHVIGAFDDLGLAPKAMVKLDNLLFNGRGEREISRKTFVELVSLGEHAAKLVDIFCNIQINDILARDGARFFDSVDRAATGGIDRGGMKELIGCFKPELLVNAAGMNEALIDTEHVLVVSEHADDTWHCNRRQFVEGASYFPFFSCSMPVLERNVC